MLGGISLGFKKSSGRRRLRRVAAKKERLEWPKQIRRRVRTIKAKQRRARQGRS